MRFALIASFLIHAGFLAYALFWIPAVPPLEVSPADSIPIEIVSIGEVGAEKAQAKDAPPEKVEKPKPKPQEITRDVKPKDKVAPEEVKAAHEKNVEKDVPKPKQKPEEAKPEEPKPLDSKELAALLKEDPPPEPKKEEPKKEEPKKEEPKKEDVKKEEPKKEEPPPDQAALDAILKQSVEEQAEADKKAAEEAAKKAAEAIEKAEAEAKKKAEAEAKKKAEAEAKKKAEAEAKKKAEAEAKKKAAEAEAKKKKTAFDTDAVADLLNKIPDEAAAPAKKTEETGTPDAGAVNTSGLDKEMKATLGQAVAKRIYDCWTLPPGAKEAGIVVKIRFQLSPDGKVKGEPKIMNASGDPLFDTTARSAVAAIFKCEAYDFLPPDQYDLWKQFTINFKPESDQT